MLTNTTMLTPTQSHGCSGHLPHPNQHLMPPIYPAIFNSKFRTSSCHRVQDVVCNTGMLLSFTLVLLLILIIIDVICFVVYFPTCSTMFTWVFYHHHR